jgi:hypothetical protein
MGEFKIWVDERMRLGRGTPVAGEARVAGDGASCNLNLKIAAKSVRAAIVASAMMANGTSGCGFRKASVMSLAAISNRSVDDNCGI